MTEEELYKVYDKKDIKKVYVAGGYELYYPVVEDNKPHLAKIKVKVEKKPKP